MKKILLFTILCLSFLSAEAQLRPKKKAAKKAIKSTQLDKPVKKLVGCDLTMSKYKEFVFHTLKKPDNAVLDYTTALPGASVKYSGGMVYLFFGKARGHVSVPVFNQHTAISDGGIYGGIMLEGWGTLVEVDNDHYHFSFNYEAGNYNNITEVVDIYRQGNNTYADVKRPNGSIEQVRIMPGFIIENGCELPVR